MAASMKYIFFGLVTVSSCMWFYRSYQVKQMEGNYIASLQRHIPAIGVSLTATHGTLSIKRSDGTFEDIGRVEGSKEYIKMMQRLSLPSNQHASPPYRRMEEGWQDIPRQLRRSLRKRLGIAASSDVRILSVLTKSLLDMLPPTVIVPSIVISYPPIPALYNEDILDTARHLGIIAQTGSHNNQPRESVATLAGNSIGLCDHPADRDKCYYETRKFPWLAVLHIEYSKQAMTLHSKHTQGAYDTADVDIEVDVMWDMGSEDRGTDYLIKLEAKLEAFHTKYYGRHTNVFDVVVLMTGDKESIGQEDVQKIILETVERLAKKPIESYFDTTEFVAARGAAELCARGRLFESKRLSVTEDLKR